MSVSHTFHSPRHYHPRHSLLGRAFRRWTGDRLRGEAFFLVALTGLALGLLLAHYLGWALLEPYLRGSPTRQMVFWGGQVAAAMLWAVVGLWGVQPGVTVTCTPQGLRVAQGRRTRSIAYNAVKDVSLISAVRYHRHYRRYAATGVFSGRPSDEVLLLRTDRGPVVIALSDPEAQAALKEQIEEVWAPAQASAVPSNA